MANLIFYIPKATGESASVCMMKKLRYLASGNYKLASVNTSHHPKKM
jgi:hypothetical protein